MVSRKAENKSLVSIIVPVYNCEKYVEECIKSLLCQTYFEIEVILVDDGSADDSLKICREYEKQDSRIKVFTQKNQGVSSARNVGIQMATGKYLSFVDADDYVEEDFIKSLIDIIPANGISICGYKRQEEEEIKCEYIVSEEMDVAALYRYIFTRNDILSGCCNKLFLRQVIADKNLHFNRELAVGEDMLFLAEYLKCVHDSFGYFPKATYIYRKNKKSALQSTYFNQVFDDKKASCLEAVEKLSMLYDNPEPYIKNCFAYRTVRSSLWLLFQMIASNEYIDKYADRIKQNVRENIKGYFEYREGSRLEHIMAGLTYISPKCVFYIGMMAFMTFPNIIAHYLN